MSKEFWGKYPKWGYLLIGLVIIMIIVNGIFITTTFKYKEKLDNANVIVFTFQGENEVIHIDDGLIIITPDKHQVFGGNIKYIGTKDESIKFYANELYLYESQVRNTIVADSVSYQGKDFNISLKEVLKLNESVGEISSTTLFNEEDLEKVKDNLYFELKYETIDGDVETTEIKLNVKEYSSKLQ